MGEGISEYRFREHIIPLALRLAGAILEMDWLARYGISPPCCSHIEWHKIQVQIALILFFREMTFESFHRLDPMNHSELFPTVVTAIVDTFPIRVRYLNICLLSLGGATTRMNITIIYHIFLWLTPVLNPIWAFSSGELPALFSRAIPFLPRKIQSMRYLTRMYAAFDLFSFWCTFFWHVMIYL